LRDGLAKAPLTQIKDDRQVRSQTPLDHNDEEENSMSPFLMQPFVLGPMIVGLLFAATLLICSITDARN
jgi:hypothetical protein